MTLPFPPTIATASRDIAAGKLSPVALTELCLARIDRYNPSLRAFILVVRDEALAAARQAEAEIKAGLHRGPLHGIPIGLKDAIDTAGMRTTIGSRVFADRVPSEDAECVRRLKRAGAIILGKQENHEFCLGGPAMDAFAPPARNPWNPEVYAGGSSSGGGVAIAAGMCLASIGTDTGGSIRIPATFNAVAGHKPTYGMVSSHGVHPLALSLDHVGPLAWTQEDCAIVLQAIAGADPKDRFTFGVKPRESLASVTAPVTGLRVGIVRNFFDGPDLASPEIVANVEASAAVLARCGAKICDMKLPDLWDYTAANATIVTAESFITNRRWLREAPEKISGFSRGRMFLGAFLRAEDYAQAQRVRRALIRATREAMKHVDALLVPGSLAAPPPVAAMQKFYYLQRPLLTSAFNLTGMPANSVPSGFDAAGLPLAIQIAARPLDDAVVLRLGHAFEQATGWRQWRAPLERWV
jgi:aspartyl-tRNA(Asn)/glutamyl-tRNA(Gln) amidotransferase subunit A